MPATIECHYYGVAHYVGNDALSRGQRLPKLRAHD